METTKPKPFDVTAYCWELAADAVKAYYADPLASACAFYLYHRPGALRFFPEMETPDGWTLADPKAQRGFTEARVLTAYVYNISGRLPILPAGA